MTYRIPLPDGGRRSTLDLVEPNSTAVQRLLRRDGLASYEPPTMATLLALFDEQGPGFTFFDVGANMGLYALVCSALFEPEHVDAFEPTPATAAVFRRAVQANDLDIDVIEAAVGDVAGRAELHLSDRSDSSNSLVSGFKSSSAAVVVDTLRLDDHVATSGHHPNVIKIDVETFEPAVLAGASATIATHRPYLVIEVLNRGGRNHGQEIEEAMSGYGYSYYELSSSPTWQERSEIIGATGTTDCDWLLAPEPLAPDFASRWRAWSERTARCTRDRNGPVPLLLTVRAAFERGGVGEVIAAARRYGASILRSGSSSRH